MLQSQIDCFFTVGCFRANTVVFFGFKKFAQRFANDGIVVCY